MDGACTVSFTGDHGGSYFIPCDSVNDFDDQLVYYGSDTLTIWEEVNHYGHKLIVQPMCTPAWINTEEKYVYTNPEDVVFNDRAIFYREYDSIIMFCLVLLCAFRAITIFRR